MLMNQLGVGDPAASSLSSCLCAFPGGVSLLTETGLLRPFLVPETSNREEGSAAEAIVAAAPLRLSEPSPEGTFPIGAEVPVDHAWSQDGRVLVVLRRSSYTAYSRGSPAAAETAAVTSHRLDAAVLSQHHPPTDEPESSVRTSPSRDSPSLGLAEVHTGSNGFEGKVVACCLLGARTGAEAAAATKITIPSVEVRKRSSNKSNGGRAYLVAVGGAFGVECHALEFRQCPEEVGTEKRKQASPKERGKGNPTAASAATCRPLASIFEGYLVVALAFSQDSGLMAAASMTGHVKVWDVAALVAPSSPRQSNGVLAKKESAARGRGGGKKKGLGEALSATRPLPECGRHSDIAPLWDVVVRARHSVLARGGVGLWPCVSE